MSIIRLLKKKGSKINFPSNSPKTVLPGKNTNLKVTNGLEV